MHLPWRMWMMRRAIYDGVLLPRDSPQLQGQHDWAWIMVGTYCLVVWGEYNFGHCSSCTAASFDMKQATMKAKWQCGHTQPSPAAPSPRAHRAPALWSMVNMPPRAASSSSDKGAMAASSDCYDKDKEEGSFHQFHAIWVQWGSPREEREAPPCWLGAIPPPRLIPWLRTFQEQCKEDEPMWWPLIHLRQEWCRCTGLREAANGCVEMDNYHLHISHLPACTHGHEHWTIPQCRHYWAWIECAAMAGSLCSWAPVCWGSCKRQALETWGWKFCSQGLTTGGGFHRHDMSMGCWGTVPWTVGVSHWGMFHVRGMKVPMQI